jgi:hypothetical protein
VGGEAGVSRANFDDRHPKVVSSAARVLSISRRRSLLNN